MGDLIDKYLRNELSKEEEQLFNEQLAKDKSLRDELQFRKQVMEALNYRKKKEYKKVLDITEQKIKRKQQVVRIAMTGSAAAILFIMVFSFIKLNQNNEEVKKLNFAYIEKYYETPIFYLSQNVKGEQDKSTEPEAYKLFKAGDFVKAEAPFEQLRKDNPDDQGIIFHLAVVYLENRKLEKAKLLFKELNYDGCTVETSTCWYLALILLEEDDSNGAIPLLEKLSSRKNDFQEQAQEILNQL